MNQFNISTDWNVCFICQGLNRVVTFLFGPRCLHPKVVLFNLREDLAVDCDGSTFSSREVSTLRKFLWRECLTVETLGRRDCRAGRSRIRAPDRTNIKVLKGTELPVFWSGFDSRVGASHRVNLIAPSPLGQNCPRKIAINYELHDLWIIYIV